MTTTDMDNVRFLRGMVEAKMVSAEANDERAKATGPIISLLQELIDNKAV